MSSRSPSPQPAQKDLSGSKPPRFNNGWTKQQEELMAEWSDIAASYRWMHDKAEKKTALSNLWITVPVIVLSTLTGSANFMLNSIVGEDPNAQKYAQIGIGSVSIFTGILTTLGNFFRYAQNSEANRVASIAWGKFQRQVAIELALHPKERIDALDFLKICRSDLDRLIEQSPPIPDDIIKLFEKEFENLKDFKKPDIAHGVDHTKVFNSNDSRMKQLAVDAIVFMKQKRKVWHEAMMPEVDKRLDKMVTDLSGSVLSAMQDRIKTLEAAIVDNDTKKRGVANQSLFFSRTSTRAPSVERMPLGKKNFEETLPGATQTSSDDLVSSLRPAKEDDVTIIVDKK